VDPEWALPVQRNVHKDVPEYLQMTLHKTKWMSEAARSRREGDPEHLIWVDFGLFHVFNDKERFQAALRSVIRAPVPCNVVRVAGIWPVGSQGLDYANVWRDGQQRVLWYMAGGVFGGSAGPLMELQREMEHEITVLQMQKRLMWEVNVWALILARRPDLFQVYASDHTPAILENY